MKLATSHGQGIIRNTTANCDRLSPAPTKADENLMRFLRRGAGWFRIFRPHFWHVRARRCQVQVALQELLPTPYDPYGIELAYRSECRKVSANFDVMKDTFWHEVIYRLDAKALEGRLAQVGAFEAGAHAAYDVGFAFSAIDQDFYSGVALSAEKAVNSLSDLSTRFAPESLLERLKTATHGVKEGKTLDLQGHVGEAVVARHLQEAGIDAHLAQDPSQQAWDINIEGHLVNVKTWKDVGSLSSHFSSYSGTPVLVPGNAQHIPESAIHFDSATGEGFDHVRHALDAGAQHLVLADHALSAGAVHDQVQHATGLIAGDSHIFDGDLAGHHTLGHLPYVTMALSGFREFNLLLGDKTCILVQPVGRSNPEGWLWLGDGAVTQLK